VPNQASAGDRRQYSADGALDLLSLINLGAGRAAALTGGPLHSAKTPPVLPVARRADPAPVCGFHRKQMESDMQDTNTIRNNITFDQYLGQVQERLVRCFGRNVGTYSIQLIRDYWVRGCTPEYCAWALARMGRPRLTP